MTADGSGELGAAASLKSTDLPLSVPIATGIQAAVDITAILAAGMLCWLVSLGWKSPGDWWRYLVSSFFIAIVAATIASFSRLYSFEVVSRPNENIVQLTMPLLKAFLVFLVLTFSFGHLDLAFSRIWTYLFLAVSEVAFLLERRGVALLIRRFAYRGQLVRNAVIVGSRGTSEQLVRKLASKDIPWVRFLGLYDDRLNRSELLGESYLVSGSVAELVAFSRECRIDDIFIVLPWGAESRLNEILERMQEIPANIHLVPEIGADWLENARFVQYFGINVLKVTAKPIEGWNYVVKWIEDKLVALTLLITLSPILLIAALAVRLESPGPILFRQKRLGFNNNIIQVLKFRTMYHEARDENAERLTSRNDSRVTRVGRLLRRYSIDELPQLFNVLKGEMSVVGPRPHALRAKAAGRLYEEVVENYAERHKIKPGITGLAQVNGWRGDTETEYKIKARVKDDIFYMENWSFMYDIKIILKTIYVVITAKEAY